MQVWTCFCYLPKYAVCACFTSLNLLFFGLIQLFSGISYPWTWCEACLYTGQEAMLTSPSSALVSAITTIGKSLSEAPSCSGMGMYIPRVPLKLFSQQPLAAITERVTKSHSCPHSRPSLLPWAALRCPCKSCSKWQRWIVWVLWPPTRGSSDVLDLHPQIPLLPPPSPFPFVGAVKGICAVSATWIVAGSNRSGKSIKEGKCITWGLPEQEVSVFL